MMGCRNSGIRLNVTEAGQRIALQGEQVRVVRESRVLVDTTENWSRRLRYVPASGDIIVYADKGTIVDEAGATRYVPGVKIGDGNAYCVDLPFVGDDLDGQLLEHITDRAVHVSAADREFWNNKLNFTLDGEDLQLTRD